MDITKYHKKNIKGKKKMKKIKQSTIDKIVSEIQKIRIDDLDGDTEVWVSVRKRSIELTGPNQMMPESWFCVGYIEYPQWAIDHAKTWKAQLENEEIDEEEYYQGMSEIDYDLENECFADDMQDWLEGKLQYMVEDFMQEVKDQGYKIIQ